MQQSAAARPDADRPRGAARARARAQTFERSGGVVPPSDADGGLDQLDERAVVRNDLLVLTPPLRRGQGLVVLAVAVVHERLERPVQGLRRALTAHHRALHRALQQRLHRRPITAARRQLVPRIVERREAGQ